ncbi:bifunctional 2-C-methyl-D-erythritol 4-phosphate cytidylyltransferase/2-C-methyl-D-erythritol 2,4-cyclodiphosphate synthase [Novosphingobium huizhouense]|uniref:bifunctional 2-C-methyl-D-erythritol 4-phosphate cytidylyltransferase/2-C-methyl-D-erythritol 2,4-cyclodiphosphate synthase n=1 Tax=Novosphingobium huizhouense TaxID=2866625 RepID=UPI001CD8A92E|nr:bifunctional 2-C-methyl-D-erythritol 4-phosphate cytidylyltransferase/2-C-methyl-D-erythritol 2,4-cyclodiphosphate synthase [Novosphingobium huizhouense]
MTAPLSSRASSGVAAVIVAAGKGLRAGGEVPKQFAMFRGKPLVRHSAQALAAVGVAPIVVAIPEGWDAVAQQALAGIAAVRLVQGGATRRQSVALALEALAPDQPECVLIHDAARPDLPQAVVARLIEALAGQAGSIPVLPVVDSVVRGRDGMRDAAVSRDGLYRVQTPQAFRFDAILAAHRAWDDAADAGDDAEVAEAAGLAVALVQGDERLRKVTFAEDFEETPVSERYPRTGMGFDVHRLAEGEDLWLCGVKVPHHMGLAGHSDADVAIHALVDAILGAIGEGDIGDHFPPSDPKWKGASSDRFLAHAVALARRGGFGIGNVDVTIICEAPKIGPHKQAMRVRLGEIMGIPADLVSVKATTTERLGLTGRGEGIAAQAVATLVPRFEEIEQ